MSLVNANTLPLLSAFWLVDDSTAVYLRYVLTCDRMMSFLSSQSVLQLFILLSSLSSHGHPHISSHGPLKTSSHLAFHIHASPFLTRL